MDFPVLQLKCIIKKTCKIYGGDKHKYYYLRFLAASDFNLRFTLGFS